MNYLTDPRRDSNHPGHHTLEKDLRLCRPHAENAKPSMRARAEAINGEMLTEQEAQDAADYLNMFITLYEKNGFNGYPIGPRPARERPAFTGNVLISSQVKGDHAIVTVMYGETVIGATIWDHVSNGWMGKFIQPPLPGRIDHHVWRSILCHCLAQDITVTLHWNPNRRTYELDPASANKYNIRCSNFC